MEIRKAKVEDSKAIMELLKQVNNVHAELRPDLFMLDKTKYDLKELEAILSDDTKPIFVYLDENNKVEGYAFCLINDIKGNNLISYKSIYIDDICVDQNYRKNHVGKNLCEYVCKYAQEIGCYNITLNVWAHNDAAIKFYESCGFTTQKTVLEKRIK